MIQGRLNMLKSFYKYIVDHILAGYFSKNVAKRGEHYCIVIENASNREGIIDAFKKSTHSKSLTIEGIYEGKIKDKNLDKYDTIEFDADDNGDSVPFIIADVDTGREYLPTIRNAVNDGKKYQNYATFFILNDYATVETLSTSSINLADAGYPLNAHKIKDNIKQYMNTTANITEFEKEYLTVSLDKVVSLIEEDSCDMFDFEDILSALQNGTIKNSFNKLEYFPDQSIYSNQFLTPKNIKERVKANRDFFTIVNMIMANSDDDNKGETLSKYFDEKLIKRILKDENSGDEWKKIDLQDILNSNEIVVKTANLSFESIDFTANNQKLPDSDVIEIKQGKGKKTNNYYIVCSSEPIVKVKLSFNKPIKDRLNDEIGSCHDKSLTIELDDKNVSFWAFENDCKHVFVINKINTVRQTFSDIMPYLKLNSKGDFKITVPEDIDSLKIGFGDNEIPIGSEQIEITNDDFVLFSSSNSVENKIDQSFTFSNKKVNVTFAFDNVQVMNKSSLELFELVWTRKSTYKDARLQQNEGLYTYAVVSNDIEEFSTPIEKYRDLLVLEQKMISQRSLYLKCDERGEYFCQDLKLDKNVRSAINDIFDYYSEKGSVPTLTYLDEKAKSLYQNYINVVTKRIDVIQNGNFLSEEEYSMTKLGVVEGNDGEVMLSPFHPVLVSFMLEFANRFDNRDYQNNILKVLGSSYLLPYISINDVVLCPHIDEFSDNVKTWLFYEPISRHEQNHSCNIATKMVFNKLNAFVKQFNYLFLNEDCPIIINTFGISDDTNILKGIVLFIINQYINNKDFKVQKIELHEYVQNLYKESFFEKLNRLSSDDLIGKELSRIGIKTDDKVKYTCREIIHQLFTRVTFYKHDLASCTENVGYSHIAFYQMDTNSELSASINETISYPFTNSLRTELSLNGLISIPSTTLSNNHVYRIGYGTKGVPTSPHFIYSVAKAMNELYAAERMHGQYHQIPKGCCIAKTFEFNKEELLEHVYQRSNWVTFLNPEVDLDFFYKQEDLYIVHYTDQYTINAKYDSITVTKHIDRYKDLLFNSFKSLLPSNTDKEMFTATMLKYFNSLNGSWLLNVANETDYQVQEKISLVAAVKAMTKFLSRNPNITWIPVSLGEILRVTGSIGLPQDYLFSASALKAKGKPLSDDLLMIGFHVDTQNHVKLYFYPVEVKYGKNDFTNKGELQVANTYTLIRQRLFGELTFVKEVYRTFFATQVLTNSEKMRANGLFSEDAFHRIDKCRYDLLNAKYEIVDKLPMEDMGVAALVSFSLDANSISTDILDNIPIVHLNFNKSECIKFIDDSLINSSNFIYSNWSSDQRFKDAYNNLENNIPVAENFTESDNDDVMFDHEFDEDETEADGSSIENIVQESQIKSSDFEITESQKNEGFKSEDDESDDVSGITLKIGEGLRSHTPIYFYPNNTNEVSHPNLGIIGTMGTGKTQFARSIIAQFSKESIHNVNKTPIGMLVFDYKGDYNDSKFLQTVGGECFNSNYPFNPLKLIITDNVKSMNLPSITAERIADSMTKSFGLGDVQSLTIKKTIVETYADFGITKDSSTWSKNPPTMQHVVDKYLATNDAKDKAYKIFDTLNDYQLFTTDQLKCVSLFEWLDSVKVIDLTIYEDSVKKLIVSLILDLFYAEMKQLQGSAQKDGFREIRSMILVDEAHQFMKMKFSSLRRIISEGRMFGVGMILSTQNLSDFKADEDYSSFIKSWIVHNVGSVTKSDMYSIFGSTDPNIDSYMTFISKAKIFNSICKIGTFAPTQMIDLPYFKLVEEDERFMS